MSPVLTICPAHFTNIDLVTLIISGDEYNYKALPYEIFSGLLLVPSSSVQIFSSVFCCQSFSELWYPPPLQARETQWTLELGALLEAHSEAGEIYYKHLHWCNRSLSCLIKGLNIIDGDHTSVTAKQKVSPFEPLWCIS
jgi:hypothetical protein